MKLLICLIKWINGIHKKGKNLMEGILCLKSGLIEEGIEIYFVI